MFFLGGHTCTRTNRKQNVANDLLMVLQSQMHSRGQKQAFEREGGLLFMGHGRAKQGAKRGLRLEQLERTEAWE